MPTPISFYAGTLPHFCNHIAPLWLALPDEYRGLFHARGRAVAQAQKWGITPTHGLPKRAPLVCVASHEDYRAVKPAPVIMVNHGVGQTYNGDPESPKAVHHPSYSGGDNRERVVAFLCPSDRDAKMCVTQAPSFAIGVPYLDRYFVLPKVDSWYEYLLNLGLSEEGSKSRLVRQALHPLEATWRSLASCSCPRTHSLGEILGQGVAQETQRLLGVLGRKGSGLRKIQHRQEELFSTSSGVVPDIWHLADEGFRSSMSQSQPNVSRGTNLQTSAMLQPCSLARSNARRKQSGFQADSDGQEHSENALCTRPFLEECLSREEGRALVFDLYQGSPEKKVLHTQGTCFEPEEGFLSSKQTIALSFHVDIALCPETRWAWPHYVDAITELVKDPRYNFIGHGHPRMFRHWQLTWKKLGIPHVPDWLDVLNQASMYVCDNSSTIPEYASTNRPVLLLDAPWYRKNVHHGGRYWDWADIGVRIQDPDHLPRAIEVALADDPSLVKRRERGVGLAYDGVPMDGNATKRGVEALMEIADGH